MAFNIRSILGRNNPAAPATQPAGRRPPAPTTAPPTPRNNRPPAPTTESQPAGKRPPGAAPLPGAQPTKPDSGPARPNPDNPELYAARFVGDAGRKVRVAQTGDRAFTVSQYNDKGEMDYTQNTDEVWHDPKSGRLAWKDVGGRTSATGTSSGYIEHDNRPGGHGFGSPAGKEGALKPPTWAGHMASGRWQRG